MARGAYLEGPRQHAGPPEPLVQALVRRAARRSTARSWRRARRSRGRCSSSALAAEHRAPPPERPRAVTARRRAPTRSGARILSIGIAATGLFTFAYFSVASHVLERHGLRRGSNLLWTILFVTISVIYRPVEQLLSRTIATRRAQGHEAGHPLRGAGARSRAASRSTFLVVAFALKSVIVDAFDGAERCTGSSSPRCSPTPRPTSRAATSPGTSGSGSTAGSCCFEAVSRFAFPVAVAVGVASGQTAVALGIAGRAVRLACSSSRGRCGAPPPRAPHGGERRARRGRGARGGRRGRRRAGRGRRGPVAGHRGRARPARPSRSPSR